MEEWQDYWFPILGKIVNYEISMLLDDLGKIVNHEISMLQDDRNSLA